MCILTQVPKPSETLLQVYRISNLTLFLASLSVSLDKQSDVFSSDIMASSPSTKLAKGSEVKTQKKKKKLKAGHITSHPGNKTPNPVLDAKPSANEQHRGKKEQRRMLMTKLCREGNNHHCRLRRRGLEFTWVLFCWASVSSLSLWYRA